MATEVLGSGAGAPRDAGPAARREYLSFRLGHEEYAADILKVQEIRNYETVTAIPQAPAHVKGVINLRGVIVPVMDLRRLLGLAEANYGALAVMIVLNLGQKTIAVVVDAVSDVVALAPEQIRPAPELTGAIDTRYVLGLGTIDDRMLILADMERLLAADDAGTSRAAA